MHHYFEAITNTSGDSLVSYYARVIDPATQNTVTMSADDNGTPIVTKSGVDNMGSTDDYGNLDFYVVPGTYHLDIYAPNATSFIFRVPNVAMNSSKGDTGAQGLPGANGVDGAPGSTGPANSTYATLALLKAAPVSNGSYILMTAAGPQVYNYVAGDFSALVTTVPFADFDFIALNSVPATTGALVLDRGKPRTFGDFGAVGIGLINDTAAVQAGINWSSAARRIIRGIGTRGSLFDIEKATIKTLTQIDGDHKRGTVFRALKLSNVPTDYYGLVEIDAGPVVEVKIRDVTFECLTALGNANERQIGYYIFGRANPSPAYPNGGLYDSTFTRLKIQNSQSHAMWSRGGTVDNPAVPGTYSFLLPNQLNNFFQCDFVRGGQDNATAVLLTGQNGQFLFKKCSMGSSSLNGFAVSIGREFIGGGREQSLISGAGLYAGSFVSPGAITFEQCTIQGIFTGILTDQSNVVIDNCDFETVGRSITTYGGNVVIDKNEFRNAGSFNGNGWLVYSNGSNISGRSNVAGGATDRIWVIEQPHTARFDLEIITPYTAGKTVGTWLGTGIQSNGTMDLGSAKHCKIGGETFACVNVQSGLLPGEWQDLYVAANPDRPVIFLASGVLDPPGGRLILRVGDTARVTRFEESGKFIFEATVAELTSGQMPTSGHYLAGEYVRNTNMTASGTTPLGWQRLTTGSAHVAGTDWRVLNIT